MRRSARFLAASLVAAVALVAVPRVACAQEEGEFDGLALRQSRGPKLDIGPTLVLPLHDDGPYGGGLTLDGRYDIQLGRTVVAPGVRLAGYSISDRLVGLAMPTVRLTLPIGVLAPFIVGGAGVGGLTSDGEWGAGLLGGGGIMIHLGRGIAFGAELSYQAITGSEMNTVTFTPYISFGS